ncbi:MAG TPA: type II secretion system protein [Patescibacteria group bacterium]|nr:type II secretion system protein [Patescibacteria group bacterium]
MNRKFLRMRGFTLIEVMVALAIFSLIAVLVTNMLFAILRATTKTEALKEVRQNGELALTVIEQYVRSAQSIVTCTAGLDTISVVNADTTVTTIAVSEDPPGSGIRKIHADTNGTLLNMTGSLVTVDTTEDLLFNCDEATDLVEISFRLSHVSATTRQEERASSLFRSVVKLRN